MPLQVLIDEPNRHNPVALVALDVRRADEGSRRVSVFPDREGDHYRGDRWDVEHHTGYQQPKCDVDQKAVHVGGADRRETNLTQRCTGSARMEMADAVVTQIQQPRLVNRPAGDGLQVVGMVGDPGGEVTVHATT